MAPGKAPAYETRKPLEKPIRAWRLAHLVYGLRLCNDLKQTPTAEPPSALNVKHGRSLNRPHLFSVTPRTVHYVCVCFALLSLCFVLLAVVLPIDLQYSTVYYCSLSVFFFPTSQPSPCLMSRRPQTTQLVLMMSRHLASSQVERDENDFVMLAPDCQRRPNSS